MKFNIYKNALIGLQRLPKIGPGAFVAAAFIGPGTVTMCSLAGLQSGTELLWALVLSTLCTLILQEIVIRITLVSGKEPVELIHQYIAHPVIRGILLALLFFAIVLGNAAYEAGNFGGAILGFKSVFPQVTNTWFILMLLGGLVFWVLYKSSWRRLQQFLVILVIGMSLSFLWVAAWQMPPFLQLLHGMFVPFPFDGDLLTVAALVGTTVVPYNLFLHASMVKKHFKGTENLSLARWDAAVSIVLGGFVSMAIVVAMAPLQGTPLQGIETIIDGLVPVYGPWAVWLVGGGLLAAGFSSAITAALAAAIVGSSVLGLFGRNDKNTFMILWVCVLLTGLLFQTLDIKPILLIQLAQIANGLILPVVASLLWWLLFQKKLMGRWQSAPVHHVLIGFMVLLCWGLGIFTFFKVLKML